MKRCLNICLFLIVSACSLSKDNDQTDQILRLFASEVATANRSAASSSSNSTNNFKLGGNITGLSGIIFLQNNAAEQASFNVSGRFEFPQSYPDNSNYVVTISRQPNNQTCSIVNGFGKVSGADIRDIIVNCLTN